MINNLFSVGTISLKGSKAENQRFMFHYICSYFPWGELLRLKKFQKVLILAFETNMATTSTNCTFLEILEHHVTFLIPFNSMEYLVVLLL